MESTTKDQPTEGAAPTNGETTSAPTSGDPTVELKSQLEAAQAKAAEYLDGWQRARADYANYKKRIERENADQTATVTASVLTRSLLPVLDDFELALKNAPAEGEGGNWVSGLKLVHKKFITVLENEGIKRIEAEGQQFDPNVHEAVIHEDAPGVPSGQIIEILRQGYKLGDRVLRPALVKVAK